jgi:hypothetical protein
MTGQPRPEAALAATGPGRPDWQDPIRSGRPTRLAAPVGRDRARFGAQEVVASTLTVTSGR